MFRITQCLTNQSICKNEIIGEISCKLQVRWRRKPRWLPTAKSKIFKVPTRPVIPNEEREELKRLTNNYHTQIKSIRRYLTYRYGADFQASADPEKQKQIFEADLARCMEINKEWNMQQEKQREERAAKKLQEEIDFAKMRITEEETKQEMQTKEAEEFVSRLKKEAKTFITPDNIDAAIQEAIVNPVDYNYAVDIDGNKIIGRDTRPDIDKQKKTSSN